VTPYLNLMINKVHEILHR